MTTFKIVKISAILVFIGLLAGCATVSFEQPKSYSIAIPSTEDTSLGRYAAYKTAQYDGRSGFYPLNEGMDALGVRLRLAERAQKSIDLQYFLMKNDIAEILTILKVVISRPLPSVEPFCGPWLLIYFNKKEKRLISWALFSTSINIPLYLLPRLFSRLRHKPPL